MSTKSVTVSTIGYVPTGYLYDPLVTSHSKADQMQHRIYRVTELSSVSCTLTIKTVEVSRVDSCLPS